MDAAWSIGWANDSRRHLEAQGIAMIGGKHWKHTFIANPASTYPFKKPS